MVTFTEMRKTGRGTGWGGVLQTEGFNFGWSKLCNNQMEMSGRQLNIQVRDSGERPGLEMRGSVESQQSESQETVESK